MIVLSCRCPDRLMNFKTGGLQCALSVSLGLGSFREQEETQPHNYHVKFQITPLNTKDKRDLH